MRVSRVTGRSSPAGGTSADSGAGAATRRAGPEGHGPAPAPAVAPSGAAKPSTTTWALVPETPNALTAARGGRSASRGHAVGSAVTRTGSRSQSRFGLGSRKCRWRGITPRCMASTTLISPAIPAADSRWPTLVLTEPINSGHSAARPLPYTAAAACTSIVSPRSDPAPCASR